MGSFGGSISANLSKLASFLGLKATDKRRMQGMGKKLAASKAGNVDRLEALKQEIAQLEARVLAKKKEYDAASGDTRKIISREMERLFRELDRLHARENIISANIERISAAWAKFEEYKAAQESGLSEGELDDLALELEEALDNLKQVDRASKDLEQVKYQAPDPRDVDIEKRTAELAGEHDATEADSLSPETEKRLKELEKENPEQS